MPMLPLPMADRTRTSDAALLGDIRIAKPCSADWSAMEGDDRSRFCRHCEKNVYNLSAMTASEAAALIREKEGKMCIRYYHRADGKVLTQDCPVGVALWKRRMKRAFAASIVGAASVVLAATDMLRLSHGQKPLIIERMQIWAERLSAPPLMATAGTPTIVKTPATPAPVATPEPEVTPVTMGTPAPSRPLMGAIAPISQTINVQGQPTQIRTRRK